MHMDYMVQKWLYLAKTNIETSEFLFNNQKPPSLEIICFLCQQSAETSLKGLLQFGNVKIPRTHDLSKLYRLGMTISEKIKPFSRYCDDLKKYAVALEVPFDNNIDEAEAATALKQSRAIFESISGIVAESDTSST